MIPVFLSNVFNNLSLCVSVTRLFRERETDEAIGTFNLSIAASCVLSAMAWLTNEKTIDQFVFPFLHRISHIDFSGLLAPLPPRNDGLEMLARLIVMIWVAGVSLTLLTLWSKRLLAFLKRHLLATNGGAGHSPSLSAILTCCLTYLTLTGAVFYPILKMAYLIIQRLDQPL